jgi:hypothetical protein
MEKTTVDSYRWSDACEQPRCAALKDGKQCQMIAEHPPTLDPTGHEFVVDASPADGSNVVKFPVDESTAPVDGDASAGDSSASAEAVHTDTLQDIAEIQAKQRWTPATPDPRCSVEQGGVQCALIALHDSSMNATPHLFEIPLQPQPWICTNCGTENAPAPADALVEKCTKCDEPSPAMKRRIDVALGNHNLGVGTAEEVEATARQQEGVSGAAPASTNRPVDRPLPMRGTSSGGRFDIVDAWEDLEEKRDSVLFCERDHEADVKRAKQSGQRLKEAQEAYFEAFDAFREQREKAAHQPDMFVEQERRTQFESSECEIERATGAPCPACQSQRAKGKPAKPGDPLHPAHAQHADVAKSLLVKDLEELRGRLVKKALHLTIPEIQDLPVAELQVLQRYGAQRGRIPDEKAAALIAKAHVAAEGGTDRQECRRCGEILIDRAAFDDGAKPFATMSIVGPFTCPGDKPDVAPPAPAETSETAAGTETAASPEPAAARKPRSHAKKDKRVKPAPEQHAKAQKVEGAQRAKAATKKADKKPVKKAKK